MVVLKQLLAEIARSIVDNPEDVTVLQTETDSEILLVLNVAPDDMGKVIGKHGRIAKAIRTLMKSAANTIDKKVTVEIR
ncbi:MAG: KH domain-containing protein [Ruminococcaceae bacterium]|nr:KH domain-containing protein [Oscillospiraceae bacterium]